MNYLKEHQPFANKHELNETVSSHFDRCNYQLNKTDRDVLVMLSRYAVKYPGVAHLKLTTIALSIKKSNRTIQRSLRKLELLKIIEKRSFTRKKTGGFGANLYIFLPPSVISEMSPRNEGTEPTPTTTKSANSENEPITFISEKNLYSTNTYKQVTVTHYIRFKNHLKSLTGEENQSLLSRLFGIYRAQTLRLLKFDIHKENKELLETLSLQAITITFQSIKKKKIRNPFGYYDGVLRKLIDKVIFEDVFMDYDVSVELRVPNDLVEHCENRI